MSAATPFQQTRSGRISRPPTQPSYDFLQALTADGDSSTFESLLGMLSGTGSVMGSGSATMNTGHSGGQAQDPMNAGYGTLNTLGNSHSNTPIDLNGNINATNMAANAMSGTSNWTAQTLADAAGQHSVQFDLSPMTEDEGNHGSNRNSSGTGVNGRTVKLPEWPLPPQGPGSRLAMSAEEIAARRRARNRVSGRIKTWLSNDKKLTIAMETRRKQKEHIDGIEKQAQQVQHAYTVLQAHCKNLEHQCVGDGQSLQCYEQLTAGWSNSNKSSLPLGFPCLLQ